MVLPDEPAANFDIEAEMAVVIGTWERGTRKQRAAQGLKGRPRQLTGKYSQPG